MSRRPRNTQMFALSRPPPLRIDLAGVAWRLVRVFKHDFWAATCLYERRGGPPGGEGGVGKIVVKFGREQPFCGIPLLWVAKLLRHNEQRTYRALAGVSGVPRWVGCLGAAGYAVQYIEGRPLDHAPPPPPGFFDRLGELFGVIHARGVAYSDSNKRSNILIGDDGRPYLVDYQLAVHRRDDWPWPLRAIVAALVAYLAHKDIYHLYKHKRRICPQDLTEEQQRLSRQRGGLHALHRGLTKPYRAVRRWFLRGLFRKGALVSPTEGLEDQHQPEKDTWRPRLGEKP